MRLSELVDTNLTTEIEGVSVDTRTLQPGDLFLCISGANVDRHEFALQAIEKGASAVVVSREVDLPDDIPTVFVKDVNEIYPKVFQRFYGHPERSLKTIAITGTDGKTSVATIIQQLIGAEKCAYIGTNGAEFGVQGSSEYIKLESMNTTPAPEELYRDFAQFRSAGAEAVAFEASSEAEHYGRLDSLKVDALGLTNITSEHLNTHGTLEAYIAAKTCIFTGHLKSGGTAVLNADDHHSADIASALYRSGTEKPSEKPFKVLTYGSASSNTLQIVDFKVGMKGTRVHFIYRPTGARIKDFVIDSPLLGDFNVENLACALLLALSLRYSLSELLINLPNLNIPGRLEMIDEGQDFGVMVDFAHTSNGIKRLLNFAKTIPNIRRVYTVIGQAGERDTEKRPEVGRIVVDNTDYAIFTEDDPKNEDANDTISDIVSKLTPGQNNWEAEPNRRKAIRRAFELAEAGDLVLVLGKGVDDFMKVGDTKVPWNEVEVVKQELEHRQIIQTNDNIGQRRV